MARHTGNHWALLLALACLQVALENGVQLSKGAHLLSRYATVRSSRSKYGHHSECRDSRSATLSACKRGYRWPEGRTFL